jgi:biopolymer transport protein TolQ
MTHLNVLAALGASELLGLLRDTTLLGKLILLILMILSVLSWAVMIEKGRVLAAIRRGHLEFWGRCDEWLDQRLDAGDFAAWCRQRSDLPLANLWLETTGQGTAQGVRRSAERIAYAEVEALERYLIILSTTVTISPFLGLMGTVWGIMQAFWDMSTLRSANLTVVAPGIAEALITTIAGLSAAIPAVVFYNLFVRKIDLVGNELERLRTIMEDAAPGDGGRSRATRRPAVHDKERIR